MSYPSSSSGTLDPVCPGEHWFFYWKTSAALWETRILQFSQEEIIVIPLNWGFHHESGQRWDFGAIHPERDLSRLIKLIVQLKRKFCWLLPLTPAPFLANGGVPAGAARSLSLGKDGAHLGVLDHEDKLHKIYSYFEPRVFQAFGEFCRSFAETLDGLGTQGPVWGTKFFYSDQTEICSFLDDLSPTFEQGFSRYLKQNLPINRDLTDPEEEHALKRRFTTEVQNLFAATAQESLGTHWCGERSIVSIGGGPRDTIERAMTSGREQASYFREILTHHVRDRAVSTALLRDGEKKDLLREFLTENFSYKLVAENRVPKLRPTSPGESWTALHLVDILEGSDSNHFGRNGLTGFLDKSYRWLYHYHGTGALPQEWFETHHGKIKFFHGGSLDRTNFTQMLKLFLLGQKVILDQSGLSSELERRLHLFLDENDLRSETVNFQTQVSVCTLGEGRFLSFRGAALESSDKREEFWNKIFQFLQITQPQIPLDEDVFALWKVRSTTPHELNYLDVRRMLIYNPTSYKKSVSIRTQRHFAFMRMVDPDRATAKSTPTGVEVELLPNGKISLDFGHYEEI